MDATTPQPPPPKSRRRWFQFGLGTLLTFVAGVGVGLILAISFYLPPPERRGNQDSERQPDADLIDYLEAHRLANPTCQGLLDGLRGSQSSTIRQDKRLVFHAQYAIGEDQHRVVFVYDCERNAKFGGQPETIVVADGHGRLITWKVVDNSAWFKSAEFGCDQRDGPLLTMVREQGGHATSWSRIYRFSLADDRIKRIGDVEWPKRTYEEKMDEWLASGKLTSDLIRWIIGNDGTVVLRKDDTNDYLSVDSPLPAEPFSLEIGFRREDAQRPLDLTPLQGEAHVVSLSLAGVGVDNRVAPVIKTLANLYALEFESTSLKSEGFDFLNGKHLPKLNRLALRGVWVDPAAIRGAGSIRTLEYLTLNLQSLADKDLAALETLDNLKHLSVVDAQRITGATLPMLPKLQALECAGSGIDDNGLRRIAQLPALYTLRVFGCRDVTDRGIHSLSESKSLARLFFDSQAVTGEGFRAFRAESPLRHVDATRSWVDDKALAHLGRLKNLRHLELANTLVTSDGLKSFANAQRLELLGLSETRINDTAIRHLAAIKSLKRLCVRNAGMSQSGIQSLEAAVSGLRVKDVDELEESQTYSPDDDLPEASSGSKKEK